MHLVRKLKYIKTLRALLFASLGFFTMVSAFSSAHVLNETTAEVTLRDGQVEVKIYTDLEHFSSTLQNEQAWLLGDIDALMPNNLSVNQQQAFVVNALKENLKLSVKGTQLNVERAYLANTVDDKNHHIKEIVFQTSHSFSEVSELNISFHKSLGAVHTRFVKPQYRLLGAGEKARIIF